MQFAHQGMFALIGYPSGNNENLNLQEVIVISSQGLRRARQQSNFFVLTAIETFLVETAARLFIEALSHRAEHSQKIKKSTEFMH